MNGNIDPQSNPRKRRRPALACEQCRRRKVRCDREMPCGPCIKSHPSLDCAYVDEGKAALDARLESSRLSEQDISSHSDEQHVSSGAGQSSADRARIAQLERSIKVLQGRVQDLEQNAIQDSQGRNADAGTQQSSGTIDHIAGRPSGSEQPQTFISPLAPRIKNENGRTKLFGTTHWALVFQQVSHFKTFIWSLD